ncbi:MAG: YkgJ family cysteine cluster protein [Candidatus Nanopelagicales bacterium]
MSSPSASGQVPQYLDAGSFTTWLGDIDSAINGTKPADVPCGTCTACCTSSQFIDISPDEQATLAVIPAAVLFPAPGLPKGHMLMGYDQNGCCPMFADGGCSIYDDRPRACRAYDCRIFTASSIEPDEDKPLIAQQVARWRFQYEHDRDRVNHQSVIAAARFISEHRALLDPALRPVTASQTAVLALLISSAFATGDEDGELKPVTPSLEMVAKAIQACLSQLTTG